MPALSGLRSAFVDVRFLGLTTRPPAMRNLRLLPLSLLVAFPTSSSGLRAQQPRPPFRFAEATIAQVHDAIRQRTMTCRAIVAGYLARIDAFDKRGPALNAIIFTNPNALAVADSLDRQFARTRTMSGPLFCVP